MDTLGTKIITVLISEVSLFQGKNNVYLYKAGTWSSVLINHVPISGGCILLCFHGSRIGTYTVGLYIASFPGPGLGTRLALHDIFRACAPHWFHDMGSTRCLDVKSC